LLGDAESSSHDNVGGTSFPWRRCSVLSNVMPGWQCLVTSAVARDDVTWWRNVSCDSVDHVTNVQSNSSSWLASVVLYSVIIIVTLLTNYYYCRPYDLGDSWQRIEKKTCDKLMHRLQRENLRKRNIWYWVFWENGELCETHSYSIGIIMSVCLSVCDAVHCG